MKRLFLLVAVTLVALCGSIATTNAQAPERQNWNGGFPLYGNVESVTITWYELHDKFGEVIRGDVQGKHKYCFNNAGDVIEYAHYNSDGSLPWKYIYKYDSYGNMIEDACYYSDSSLDRKSIPKYDSSGNMIEEACYNSAGSLRGKSIYKYDSSRNLIEVTKYNGDALIPEYQVEYKIVYRND